MNENKTTFTLVLRLVFIGHEVGIGVVRALPTLWKSRSRKRSNKFDGIGVGRIRTLPFSSDSAYDSDAYDPVKTRLSESQEEADSACNAGYIPPLPLTTPTI